MPNPTALGFIGVAKEVTKGTGVASTAYIPVTKIDTGDNVTYLDDMGMRGAAVDIYGEIAGAIYSDVSLSGDVFPDTIGWPLFGILGDLATTGASPPYSHVGAVKNTGDAQPKALTITDVLGVAGTFNKQYAGCQVSELGFKFNADGLFTYDAKLVGFPSSLVAKPTQSFTAIPPVPTWAFVTTIGGSTKTFVESAELNLKRNATPIQTVDGNQAPYAIWVGPLSVDGKMTIVAEDEVEMARYLTAATTGVTFDLTQGAGAALVEVKFQMTKVQYTVDRYKRDKDFLEADITFKAAANTTDVGATGGYAQLKATLQNAIAASVYQ